MTHLGNKHIDLITTAVVVLGQHFLCWNISMWHSHPRLFTATFCFCGVCKKTVHSISILLFKQSVKGEGSAHWPTATSICVTVSVFGSVRVCVCVLNSRSNPHLLHWFTPNPPPRITSWQNDSPLWPIETQHTTFDWPAEVAINPPAGLVAQLPQVRQNPNLLPPPCTLSSLLPHPWVLSSILCFSELLKWIHQLSQQKGEKHQAAKLEHRGHRLRSGTKSDNLQF